MNGNFLISNFLTVVKRSNLEEKVKEILISYEGFKAYLNLHSAVDGFRDTTSISLPHNPKNFNKVQNTNIPSFKEQISIFKEYLKNVKPNYSLVHGLYGETQSVFFITKKDNADKICRFLKKYGNGIDSTWYEKELGQILGFDECCIDKKLKENNLYGNRNKIQIADKNTPFSFIPLKTCSEKCRKKWTNEYVRLASKYGIDLKKEKEKYLQRIIKSNKLFEK